MRLIAVIFAAALALFTGRASAAQLSPEQQSQARKIYLNKCAKCHELYDPKNYNDRDWDMWMRKMKKKARLKDDQYDLLRQYLADIRAQPK